MLPTWVRLLIGVLTKAIADLVLAEDDEAREEIAMQTAEDLKRALDLKKFGG